ncbi:Uncharacterised protein [Serratia quinivorans]|jgi:hypothetical protein|nr:Uncharacterised protein [Serratia quinivorans]
MNQQMYTRVFCLAMLCSLLPACGDALNRLKGDFLKGCLQSGAPDPICRCTWDGIETHYGEETLLRIEQTQQWPEGFMQKSARLMAQCQRSESTYSNDE